MFTILSLRKTEDLTAEELAYLRRMLAEYAVTESGLWLQALPWTHFEFRWCPEMNGDNGVMGCFSPICPGCVFLIPQDDEIQKMNRGRSFWIEEIFTTVVHELRHAWQWKKSKFGYILCALPIIREFTLERDAMCEQMNAADFSDRWEKKMDYLDAKARGMAEELILPEEEK